jgi:hypothetical protein
MVNQVSPLHILYKTTQKTSKVILLYVHTVVVVGGDGVVSRILI